MIKVSSTLLIQVFYWYKFPAYETLWCLTYKSSCTEKRVIEKSFQYVTDTSFQYVIDKSFQYVIEKSFLLIQVSNIRNTLMPALACPMQVPVKKKLHWWKFLINKIKFLSTKESLSLIKVDQRKYTKHFDACHMQVLANTKLHWLNKLMMNSDKFWSTGICN